MRVRMRMLVLLLAATVCASNAQTNDSSNDSKQSVWDDPIRFSTKTKDSCTMALSTAGNYTRVRVSCRAPAQPTGRPYYCDFQGRPSQCRPYNLNPRHYFVQMMWELRKLKNACQGAKIYRPHMCRKYPDEAHMSFLASWPKTPAPKPSKPVQENLKPQTKPLSTKKSGKPQAPKHQGPPPRKPTGKPARTTTRPTEQPESTASRIATEYCWKSFHGVCSYIIGWFQN